MEIDRARLDALYERWNRPEFIQPDPLETLPAYADTGDREVAALVAASMAYGRVSSILPPLRTVLQRMGVSPREFVLRHSESEITRVLDGVVHRFAGPSELAALLAGIGTVLRRDGSLERTFLRGFRAGEADILSGLAAMTGAIREGAAGDPGHLLTDPARGSACKRLMLFLRWMVRRDAVDPGGWTGVDPARLLLPLDTWTHRIALRAGWTSRRAPDLRTVREVSTALSLIRPDDPIRYDFALSRFGIRRELDLEGLFDGDL